jgi:uncharacterized protein YcbK (DUF882 family)
MRAATLTITFVLCALGFGRTRAEPIRSAMVDPAVEVIDRDPVNLGFIEVGPIPASRVHAVLYIKNVRQTVTLDLPVDGVLDDVDAKALRKLLRCRRSGRSRRIATGVLVMLADIADRYPGHVIEIVSGYRAPPYGAPRSKHFSGHAIDFRVRGIDSKEIRDYLWTAYEGGYGVGYYPTNDFIHMDHRPGMHDTAWEQRRPNQPNRYHPTWARKLRAAAGMAYSTSTSGGE